MINKVYTWLVKVYGSEEKWMQSKLRKIIHPLIVRFIVNYKSSTFYMKYCRGLFYEETTNRVFKRQPLRWWEKIIWIKDWFRVSIPQLECNVGLVCTLKCKNCNQCNYMLTNKKYFDVSKTVTNLDKIFEAVDYIHSVSIAGGEALNAPELEKIIRTIVASKKVGCLIVVTNGTVIPTEAVYEALKHPKIELSISNYPLTGKFKANREKLYQECKKRGVNVVNNNEIDQWTDIGEPYRRRKTKLEEQETYVNCWLKDVLTLIDGKIFRCEKIYVLDGLGQRKLGESDYIDVTQCNRKQLRKELREIYRVRTLDACNFCNSPKDRVLIPSGLQVEE